MPNKGWIHDSGKYRQPTEHEADELRRLMKMMDQAVARDGLNLRPAV